MVELRALGAIDLRRDGTELAAVLTQSKHLALLLFLDIARPHGFHRRDRLVAMLWPGLDDSHARTALTRAIEHIRKELGESAIATRGDEVMLDPVYIRSDVRVLEAALANSDHMRAVQLYQGPLADGFFVDDAPEFEQWLTDQRDRIKNSVSEAAWSLAENAKQQGKISDATMFARSAVILTRDDEPTIRRLMRFLESVGDRAGALRRRRGGKQSAARAAAARRGGTLASERRALRRNLAGRGHARAPRRARGLPGGETCKRLTTSPSTGAGASSSRRRCDPASR